MVLSSVAAEAELRAGTDQELTAERGEEQIGIAGEQLNSGPAVLLFVGRNKSSSSYSEIFCNFSCFPLTIFNTLLALVKASNLSKRGV